MLDENSLASGVAALLEARGEQDLGALVRRSLVEVVGASERWSMGARDVSAHRLALVVSAADHVALASSPVRWSVLRDAFAAAVRTPETELENLSLVLALPPTNLGFHRGYRDAPQRLAETPEASAVLGGAKALCAADQDESAARALERAVLEDGFVSAGERTVRRFVLRLDAADFARTERDPLFGDRLTRAVRSAAVTAKETTIAVQLGVRLVDVELPAGAETWFVRAMTQKNAVVVPVLRDEQRARFAVVYQGELFVVELQKQKSSSWFKKADAIEWENDSTQVALVSAPSIESPESAESACLEILRKVLPGRS